jgi:hypothetical protein
MMSLIYLTRHATPANAERYLEIADQEIRRVSIIANQTQRFHKQACKAAGSDERRPLLDRDEYL